MCAKKHFDEATSDEFLPESRAKVAFGTLKSGKIEVELAEQFGLYLNQIIQFHRYAVESMAKLFAKDGASKNSGSSVADLKVLHAKIGQLTLGNDFLE